VSGVVVLCGSLGSTSAMWEPQLPALREFDVVTVEHPGHGGAPVIDVDDVADLARNVLAQVDAERFAFVGLSLGGAVGMRLALDAPARVTKLALLCTSARFGEPGPWEERARVVRAEGLEAIVDTVLERWFTPSFPDVPRWREMFLSTDREGYARCCEAIARWDARDELAHIAAPTLCIAADEDPSTPPEHVELIAGRIPGARLETIANGRHLVNVERADEVNRLLVEHLA
jgi:3-oxoadipate enol-lactonase